MIIGKTEYSRFCYICKYAKLLILSKFLDEKNHSKCLFLFVDDNQNNISLGSFKLNLLKLMNDNRFPNKPNFQQQTLNSLNTLSKHNKGSRVRKFDPIALEVRSGPLWSTTSNNNYVSFPKRGVKRGVATPLQFACLWSFMHVRRPFRI